MLGLEGAPGERNVITVRNTPNGDVVFTDQVASITPARDSGCRSVTAREVVCPGLVERVLVFLRDGDDVGRFEARQGGAMFGGDGNDAFDAGHQPVGNVFYSGDDSRDRDGQDTIVYREADRGVTVTLDGVANDGRPGDFDRVQPDIEHVVGSNFADTITGSNDPAERERFEGLGGNDTIRGGGGPDTFLEGAAASGADTFFGGAGEDLVSYLDRANRVQVQLDALRNDGQAGEADFVSGDVEVLAGGRGDDFLVGNGADNRLNGHDGNDHLQAVAGDDQLTGDFGRDRLLGEGDDDLLRARDGQVDVEVGCGTGTDAVDRDAGDPSAGCEEARVGVLRLAPRAVPAQDGTTARLRLTWRHPRDWRQLDALHLRVLQDGVEVGEVAVRPRSGRMTDEGAVRLVRRASRITRRGRTASARLALRVDPALAGERLGLEVEAVDRRGRRQLETDAGTLRVAR